MVEEQYSRTALLLGEAGVRRLSEAKVAVFGVGGVGGYAVEALARSGIGAFVLVDHDTVSVSNINRQIIATHKTVGQYKVDVMKARILDINPNAQVEAHRCFYLPETADAFDFSSYDYVIDAVDTVTAKLEIIMRAKECGVPVISSMGAGNKLDPTKFVVTDIYKTSVCPLARVMRRELKKRGVKDLKVVYSTEEARKPLPIEDMTNEEQKENGIRQAENAVCAAEALAAQKESQPEYGAGKRAVPGSVAFVPSVAGLILAGEVVHSLIDAESL